MADDEKPEQTPREMIAKLAAMTDEEFDQFMHEHFDRICRQKAPDNSALMPPRTET
jgi:hypothetical protein